jgi:hypothetical protein
LPRKQLLFHSGHHLLQHSSLSNLCTSNN